jgi:hypothetical protein
MVAALPVWDGLERVVPGGKVAQTRFASLRSSTLAIVIEVSERHASLGQVWRESEGGLFAHHLLAPVRTG